jgi:hypothetical protein
MSHEADDYIPKQSARDADYRRHYAEWLASLSPAELARVKAAGLDQPVRDDSGHGATFSERDLAETPLASAEAHQLDDIEPAREQPGFQAQHADDDEIWDVLRRLIGELLTQRNAQLSLECLALVSGVSFLGDSMSAIARRHGMTRAAVSKRCVEMTEKLGVLPSRAMRSLTARTAYARARHHRLQSHE